MVRERRTPTLPISEVPGVRLVWPGRFDGAGRLREPDRAGVPLEIIESHEATAGRDASPAAEPWRNRLVWGDNLLAMASLLPELAGRVDLVYIDPPFATGLTFASHANVGDAGEVPNQIERRAYGDGWGRHRDRWFSMLYDRLVLIRELLSERGTLYLHLDWYAGHHVRPLLDEVFGEENSLGEIIWAYGSPSGGRAAGQKLIKAHDLIFVYARRYGRHRFRTVYLPYSDKYVNNWFKYAEPDGRRYRKRWRRDREGRSYVEKQYLDESKGVPASTVWTDIQQVYADPRAYKLGYSSEVTGFPTQKPTRLLERILEISTEPGDLVADFFCGSGTTLAVAERMGRRWIGADLGRLAIQTTRARLVGAERRIGFDLVALGAGERRRWFERTFTGPRRVQGYVERMLALHGAKPRRGRGPLKGVRDGVPVHVAGPHDPVTLDELRAAVDACAALAGAELDLLGWEWPPDVADALRAYAASRNVGVALFQLPRETFESASGDGGARPLEVGVLDAHLAPVEGGAVEVVLDGFSYRRPELLPEDLRAGTRSWSDFLEAWSVDWDWSGVLRPRWSAFRTRKNRSLELRSAASEPTASPRRVLVQAWDVLGTASNAVLQLAGAPPRSAKRKPKS